MPNPEFAHAPIDPKEMAVRPVQFSNALNTLRTTEAVVKDQGGSFNLEQCRDGKKETVIVDAQVLKGMRGGISRMAFDLLNDGQKSFVDETKARYQAGEPTILEHIAEHGDY